VSRPRDALGRPLPHDADPALVSPTVPARDDRTDDEAWHSALAYLADGLPFHAHEVFEMRWRTARGEDRLAWQALAQWGAALTHAARGNHVGARRIAERCLVNLDEVQHVPASIDVDLVRSSCAELMAATSS
jgi:predicted metal-dependent hydrolase